MVKIDCLELAESFINGNISVVRKAIRGSSRIALKVAELIQEHYGQKEYERFNRLMIY